MSRGGETRKEVTDARGGRNNFFLIINILCDYDFINLKKNSR